MSDSAPPLLEEAAAADPKHSGVAAALALAICESDGALQDPAALARAVDLARRAVEAEPDRPAYRAALGRALYRSGWIAAAADELAAALEPTDAKWSLVAATSPAMTPPATTTAPAVTPSTRPADGGEADGHHDGVDAVWLDHLGDALYRLGRSEAAGQAWERARRRLAATDTDVPGRPELARLRLAVPRKLQQLAAGQTVAVSASARLDARNSP
jgi:tetratricopeptide (TPR) repeat protein